MEDEKSRLDEIRRNRDYARMIQYIKTEWSSDGEHSSDVHSDNGPAIITYRITPKGQEYVYEELWCKDGEEHRDGLPAYVRYKRDGSIEATEYYVSGDLHREKYPAIMGYNYDSGAIYEAQYYECGQRHRDNGPASVTYYVDGTICHQEFWTRGGINKTKNTFMTDNVLNHIRYEEWPSEMVTLLWLSADGGKIYKLCRL